VKPHLEETDLGELVEEVVSMLKRTVEPRVSFYKQVPTALPTALADRNGLHQVLMNVCLNAVEAIEGPGAVTISLQGPIRGEDLALNEAEPQGHYLELRVKDNGTGMTEEVKARIFEPFFTTKSRGKGTGLGLSLVYGIIGDHGGLMQVISKPKEGTAFQFYLRVFNGGFEGDRTAAPASAEQSPLGTVKKEANGGGEQAKKAKSSGLPHPLRSPASAGEAAKTFTGIQLRANRLGILVIDDNPEVLNLCRRYFAEPLFTVWTASGAEEGLQMLQDNVDDVDVVILDLVIPDGSPEEVYRKLQETKPHIATVLMSGYHQDERVGRLLDLGAQKFLKKPFSRKDLRAAVRHLLER
jgi:two-component system, cell cycle sensor histidine kinase and response regulator CckA